MIVGNPIIMILKAILNWFRLRRDYIANAVDKIPPEIKDALVASPVQEYPDIFKGVTIGNGKIRIGLPGINKDIVLDANDIETFKQSLVK